MPNGVGTFQEVSGQVTLPAGSVPIKIEHYASDSGAELQLSLLPPGGERRVVPTSSLSTGSPSFTDVADGSGVFSILDVPGNLGDFAVTASATIDNQVVVGESGRATPMRGGITDLGDITSILFEVV